MRFVAVTLIAVLVTAGCVADLPRPDLPAPDDIKEALGSLRPTPSTPSDPPTAGPSWSGNLTLHVVDVGQGDGVVIEMPDGSLFVYDCGVPPSGEVAAVVAHLVDALARPRGSAIQTLVASHGHLDHIGGCDDVLAAFDVAHVYDTWYEGDDRPQSYDRFRNAVQAEPGVVIHTQHATASLDDEQPFQRFGRVNITAAAAAAGVTVDVLWPPPTEITSWRKIADNSIVLRVTFGAVSVCLQGDIDDSVERELAKSARDFSCDVYLMGHHGSKHASTTDWLRKMDPQVAIASFGTNSYGHPTRDALCRVQVLGIPVYATHRLGTVSVVTDGVGLTVTPDRPEAADYCRDGADYWT